VSAAPGAGAIEGGNGDALTGAVSGDALTDAVDGDALTGAVSGDALTDAVDGDALTGAVSGDALTDAMDGDALTGPVSSDALTDAVDGDALTGAAAWAGHSILPSTGVSPAAFLPCVSGNNPHRLCRASSALGQLSSGCVSQAPPGTTAPC